MSNGDKRTGGIRIPTNMIIPIIGVLIVVGGWIGTYAVLSNDVDNLKLNFEKHERDSNQKISELEAERADLFTKLHDIELLVRENKTILEEMRK